MPQTAQAWPFWSPLAMPERTLAEPEPSPVAWLPMVEGQGAGPLQYEAIGAAGAGIGSLPFYDWTPGPEDAPAGQVRMVYCLSDIWAAGYLEDALAGATRDAERGIRGRVWLVLNEPERPDQCGGC